MKDTILLRAEHLSAGYSGRGKQNADIIHDIDFTLHEGERLCVIGPNGCGKTTLLRVLAGTLPYSGSLKVTVLDTGSHLCGKTVERSALDARQAARETGFLSQLNSAYFSFTVHDTVLLGRYPHQKTVWNSGFSTADRQIAEKAIQACGIGDIRSQSLATLSGGQLQRVFLARTLAQNPAVLLLDEPTNHLDLYYQLELLDRLESWIAEGRHSSIGVFHDLSLALRFADTILLMENGRIADFGAPAKVVTGTAINAVYRMDVAAAMRRLLQNW
jgi:iron complex transport system ATP-binding protein